MKTPHAVFGLALLILPFGAQAQNPTKPAAAKLTAEQILEKSLQASGGRAAFEKIKTMSIKATLDIKAQGLKGTVDMVSKSPDKVLVTTTIPMVLNSKQGYDGKVGWSQDQFTGLRKLEGAELDEIKQRAQVNELLNYKTYYKQIKLIGTQKVNGKDAYVIKMTPKTGKTSTSYFDTKTFLVVKQETVAQSPQGEMAVEAYITEYKTVDGVRYPLTMKQKLGSTGEVEIRFTDIKTNVGVDDKIFAMPAAEKAEDKK